jgi:sugar lactone lactonase YvrE
MTTVSMRQDPAGLLTFLRSALFSLCLGLASQLGACGSPQTAPQGSGAPTVQPTGPTTAAGAGAAPGVMTPATAVVSGASAAPPAAGSVATQSGTLPASSVGAVPPGMAAGGAGTSASQTAMKPQDAGTDDTDAQVPPPTGCTDCCPDGHARDTTHSAMRSVAAFTPSPTDIAICPDGNVYLTLDGPDEIWRIPASEKGEHFASVTGVQPAGMACDAQGRLFVAALALRTKTSYAAPGVLMITGKDAKPIMLPSPPSGSLGAPNGVAFVPGAGIYVTDMLGGQIVRVFEMDGKFVSRAAASNLLGVNGIAYDPASRKLVVSNSLSQAVSSLLVGQDGSLASPKVEWTSRETSPMLDGVTIDEHGMIYVANYQLGTVVRLPNQEVMAKVTNPAGLAFRGNDLLIVDYHLNEPSLEGALYNVSTDSCGAYLFGSNP